MVVHEIDAADAKTCDPAARANTLATLTSDGAKRRFTSEAHHRAVVSVVQPLDARPVDGDGRWNGLPKRENRRRGAIESHSIYRRVVAARPIEMGRIEREV